MARRTKEDAEVTRNRLLDAAEAVFYAKGVSGASLMEIAQVASLTRGAIYWHFKDKLDLFDAMLKRTTLPFELDWQDGKASLQKLVGVYQQVFASVSQVPRTRRVFDIALYKIECVGEMRAVRERRLIGMECFTSQIEHALRDAASRDGVDLPVSAACAARGLHAVFDGLLHAWLLHDARPFDLEKEGEAAVHTYLSGLGLKVCKEFV